MPAPHLEPAVVVLADADDAGVARLVSRLTAQVDVIWWRFGLSETVISAHVGDDDFRLEQPEATLTARTLRRAAVIVHRRRFLQPRPLVVSALSSPADRAFSEREWSSLIDGLLLAEEHASHSTWVNAPSSSLLTHNKLRLLLFATRAGLPVPPFSVSTPVSFPSNAQDGLVVKAISADERIDATRHLSTARLTEEDLAGLSGARLPTPSLLQTYVSAHTELRVYYALGAVLALALTPSSEHVDIRHVPREQLDVRPFALPRELSDALAGLARDLALEYCTFDLAIPEDGPPALLDITPNGDWDYFESDAAPTVSTFLAERIVARVRETAGGDAARRG